MLWGCCGGDICVVSVIFPVFKKLGKVEFKLLLLPYAVVSEPEGEGIFPSLVSVPSCPLSLAALEGVGLFSPT